MKAICLAEELSLLYRWGTLGEQLVEDKYGVSYKYDFVRNLINDIYNYDGKGVKRRLFVLFSEYKTDEEFTLINNIYEELFDYNSEFNQIIRIKSNTNFEKTKYQINFLNDQIRRFKGFYGNQNEFDNIISIIKIFDRYQAHFAEKLEMDIIFKNKENDFESICKKILSKKSNNFEAIRFTL